MQTRSFLKALSLLAVVAIPAVALPTEPYLRLRRLANCDRSLTYEQALTSRISLVGKVFELAGQVNAVAHTSDGIAFMLTLDSKAKLTLRAPATDAAMLAGDRIPRLRALIRIGRPVAGNVPTLEVLAIGHDAEVSKREAEIAQAEAEMKAKADEEAMRQEEIKRQSELRRGELSSRGGFKIRELTNPSAAQVSELAIKYLTPEAQGLYPQYKKFIYGCNKKLTPEELDAITVSILHFATRYRVDPRLAVALIIAESDFNPRCVSRAGAMGLGQLMSYEIESEKIRDPFDPVWNIKGCISLLRQKLTLFAEPGIPDGQLTWPQIEKACAAYNAGARKVKQYNGVPPIPETQRYVAKIKRLYAQFVGDQ